MCSEKPHIQPWRPQCRSARCNWRCPPGVHYAAPDASSCTPATPARRTICLATTAAVPGHDTLDMFLTRAVACGCLWRCGGGRVPRTMVSSPRDALSASGSGGAGGAAWGGVVWVRLVSARHSHPRRQAIRNANPGSYARPITPGFSSYYMEGSEMERQGRGGGGCGSGGRRRRLLEDLPPPPHLTNHLMPDV